MPLIDQLKIIKTHTNISELNIEGLYDVRLKFANNFQTDLKGVVIEDIIPIFYLYQIKLPDELDPSNVEEEKDGAMIKWNFKDIPKNKLTQHYYKLIELFYFEEMKIKIFEINKKAMNLLESGDIEEAILKFSDILDKLKSFN